MFEKTKARIQANQEDTSWAMQTLEAILIKKPSPEAALDALKSLGDVADMLRDEIQNGINEIKQQEIRNMFKNAED